MKNITRTGLIAALVAAARLTAAEPAGAAGAQVPKLKKLPGTGIPQSIAVRTTENVTQGGWAGLLNQCEAHGISRVDLLVKQDEDNYHSGRTGATLQSGELLVPLADEKTAQGWEDAGWLKEMLARAHEKNIEVWAWWPCFHDAQAAALQPKAAYTSKVGERFVDPGYPDVRARQSRLIAKLLDTYAFDGVSLDWIRYEGWQAGSQGPLGEDFARQYGITWTPDTLENGYIKARWYEARSKLVAGWLKQLVQEDRTTHPDVRWGAFILPWQFSELSQNYAMFGGAGLDFLQPMGYWRDWKLTPEWVGDRLLSQHRDLVNGTTQWPALGLDAPLEEIGRALDHVPPGLCGGVAWFTHGSWDSKTFDKLQELLAQSAGARRLFGYEKAPQLDPVTSAEIKPVQSWRSVSAKPPEAMEFPDDCSVWAVVCLAELYKRGALKPQEDDPVVPVLALHTFIEGKAGGHSYLYKCSTGYLDQLLKFIADSGFTVCPLSRLQSYLITTDPSFLPPRPLVITLDDGSRTAKTFFYPRAKKYKFPFTLGVVTSWLSNTNESSHTTDERGNPDATMTWAELKELNSSNLVEVVSHSDALHYQAAETQAAQDEKPAELTRQFLAESQRTETNEEYARRIHNDMITSRRRLTDHHFSPPTIFCWPYGEGSPAAKEIAEQAGFTHFLMFDTPPVMATAHGSHYNGTSLGQLGTVMAMTPGSRTGIPRIPVLVTDEAVPLRFPEDRDEAQEWWLALLKVGRDSISLPLLRAAIAQLTWESQRSPEVELSRAVMDYIRGSTASGTARLLGLRQAYPFDPSVTESVDKLFKQFTPRP